MVSAEEKMLVLLGKVPLFRGLSEDLLRQIDQLAHKKKVQEGGFFFFQGDPADRIFVLVQGQVRLSQSNPDGQQILVRVIGPGMIFGAIAMAQGELYPVSARAAKDSQALYWTKDQIITLVAQNPQIAVNAMQIMATHIQEFQERYRQLATERVEQRLARTLIRLASQSGRKTAEGILIDLPLTRQDLAEMTGTTLYTVSRTLSQWEARGLVIGGRERVVIRFPHGLVNIAEDLPALPSEDERGK